MSARLPLVLRQLGRPPRPPGPPRRLREPCRAASGSGSQSGGQEGLSGQQRPQDGPAWSSQGPGSPAPPARDSIAREVIQNSKEVLHLLQEKNPAFKPVLAIIQAGDENLMQEINQNLAEEAGLNITHVCLPPDSSEDEIIDEILKMNEDTRVHGLALQISEDLFSSKVLNALNPEKDVDGVTDVNLGKLVRGDAHECFVSPVARAVIELLEKSGASLDGKKILVVGAHGSLDAALQCLFQRRGSMTMNSQWKTPQLQSKSCGVQFSLFAANHLQPTNTSSRSSGARQEVRCIFLKRADTGAGRRAPGLSSAELGREHHRQSTYT
ncbi:monofunctional C1-tetrahydrofolate synthase, mitochondrial isoform X7 [Heterocephalus glaber]|uniref:Monofunctional C1-tetrahydrofolate synthase, mitochondrial isoform X7 n=1 Tax=Heterocephalus glaber TaxID=10181 RepID=A0AAX6RB77_HETGA|nr:monofunctional C1-tetrahydrofolate synthase, mitochondrial isoform X7 [Heterocephalus glaber]